LDYPWRKRLKLKAKLNISKKSPLSAREVALEILTRVEQDKSYSNLLLNQMLQKHPLERADVGLVTEIVYGTIQHLNTIDYYLNRFVAKGVHKLEPWVRSLLRLSLYQVVYLERIPPQAIVNEAVNLAK
jgi:16S rRNA (cytosine967-C5)-methyltransferase